jgi:hypothetical protein
LSQKGRHGFGNPWITLRQAGELTAYTSVRFCGPAGGLDDQSFGGMKGSEIGRTRGHIGQRDRHDLASIDQIPARDN